jgi:DNA-binding FadR family transcriptional regulator
MIETAQATLEWLVPEEQLQRSLGVTRPRVRDAYTPTE